MYYSKPDDASATFELRRLQSRDSRPRTDYFELYWQHLVPSATWGRIGAWLLLVLRRKREDVPAALRGLWTFTRLLATIAAILLVLTIAIWFFPDLVPGANAVPSNAKYPLGLTVLLLRKPCTVTPRIPIRFRRLSIAMFEIAPAPAWAGKM